VEDGTNAERWDKFIYWVTKFYDWNDFDKEEREYKLKIAGKLREVHKHLTDAPATWQRLLRAAFGGQNNLVVHYTHLPFQEWCHEEPNQAARALRALWEPSRTALESIYAFLEIVPKNIAGGQGVLLNLVSCLHMEKKPESYPVYQVTPITKAIELVGYPSPRIDSDVPHVYQHALGLFTRVLEEAAQRGLKLRDRLDAQSLLWSVGIWPMKELPISEWAEQEQSELRRYRAGAE
jgi:hypothetical protein